MKAEKPIPMSVAETQFSLRDRICEIIASLYQLPSAVLAFLCLTLTFVSYCVLPPVQGIAFVLGVAFLPVYESSLRRLANKPAASDPPAVTHAASLPDLQDHWRSFRWNLDRRQTLLTWLGVWLAAGVLAGPHLALFAGNAVFAYWLGLRPWDWTRRYGCYFLVETVYFHLKFQLPRPSAESMPFFRDIIPAGPYFTFLWAAVELIVFIKLLDFVLLSKPHQEQEHYACGRFALYLLHPFTFLAGPAIGFEDTFASYASGPLRLTDLWYSARKCLWGAIQFYVLATWLQSHLLWLREAVRDGEPLALAVDTRLLMWLWLAGMSVLLHFIYKGYVDIMLGLSRLVGFAFPEQFWFTLFAKDPVEYWQNGNRAIYKVTNYHVFNRFFHRHQITLKVCMCLVISGVLHMTMCPILSVSGGLLLSSLFLINSLLVALFLQLRKTRFAEAVGNWAGEGPARNALILCGVLFTFTLFAFTRCAFLLMVEGVSVDGWWQLMTWLVVTPDRS